MVDPAKGLSEFARMLLVPDDPHKSDYLSAGGLRDSGFAEVDGPSSGPSGKRFRD